MREAEEEEGELTGGAEQEEPQRKREEIYTAREWEWDVIFAMEKGRLSKRKRGGLSVTREGVD